ncbi:radical SAM protein [Mobilitalea sibirica]|uniref:Radical SAM protein n=1 Tax=Mobilitalea sibirica TaxID=1462919 RepID=A0A8J7H210_9FIRM|nr:radical SAM protein [Mobilitalea sibirica]MBH1940648.1 radical SAM protein [Mobilitalea sibirica]
MPNIYYFNINYYCNNDCVFCFSSSTGNNSHQISLEDFMQRINFVRPTMDDKVVFNGGEPSIHPEFYLMVNYVNENYNTNVVVYTNGVFLDLIRIKKKDNLMFIVPIHGEQELHNCITRNNESFSSTIKNLQKMQKNGINYTIKFIVNSVMIDDNFKINMFLDKYNLSPNEIVIARLNETKKSKANQVASIDAVAFINYLNFYDRILRENYVLKYLDIPFCYINDVNIESLEILNIPQFYFNDYHYKMLYRSYYKQIKIGESCEDCECSGLCSMLSSSYLTLSYRDGWRIVIE